MNMQLDDSVNTRFKEMQKDPNKKVVQTDILWITPKRLALLFVVCLVITIVINGVV